jgi:hypothetical protein
MRETDRRHEDAIEKSHPVQRSGITPERSSDVETQRRLDDVTSTLLVIMERLRLEEKELEKRTQIYPYPFVVDDDAIKKLDKRARDRLNEAGILSGRTVSVHAEVRFSGPSTFRFATLEECLDKAGDRSDPEEMTIEWSVALQEPLASTAKIQAVFTTEKPPQVAELGWFEFSAAKMKLEIAGPDRQWVDNTFSALDPLFNAVRCWGIYRPLRIFRNRTVISIASWATGLYAQVLFLGLTEWLRRPAVNNRRQAQIDRIVNQPMAETKIDQFVIEVFRPVMDNPILDGVGVLMGSLLVMAVVTLFGYKLYPKAAPRAGINIGLAATRYNLYQDTFRLIIVSVIFLGFLVPFIRSCLFALIF